MKHHFRFILASAVLATLGSQANAGLPAALAAQTASTALKPQTLAQVTSDQDSNISRLAALVNDGGEVKAIRFDTKHFDQTPVVTTTKTFDMKAISSPQGSVLLNESGYDAVIIKASLDEKAGQGSVAVRFLTNALFNTYQTCNALARRGADGKWQLLNAVTKHVVQDLFVQSHGTGITTIKGICP